jgi:hypothetical protein
MDFQRLFRRKEEYPAPTIARVDPRESFNAMDVLLCEGELLEGTSPACLVWSSVGGSIKVKAEKILGILEGRTRIKAAALWELYPALFEKAPNPGTEFNIPLRAVVMQLEDLFNGLSFAEALLDEFDTPFGQLAREDEARLQDKTADQPSLPAITTPTLFTLPQPESKPKQQDQGTDLETPGEMVATQDRTKEKPTGDGFSYANGASRAAQHPASPVEQTDSSVVNLNSDSESHRACFGESEVSSSTPKIPNGNIRRYGHQSLQELYLTDEPLDGAKVAEMILQLPRVVDVVIMLSDGAALGGSLSGGLSEALLSRTPDFVKHLLDLTKSIQGGPVKFVTFSGHACQVSLTIDEDVSILTGHQGKNLPPGLRERLLATARALSMIYGSQS